MNAWQSLDHAACPDGGIVFGNEGKYNVVRAGREKNRYIYSLRNQNE